MPAIASDRLRDHAKEILMLWEQRAHKEIASSLGVSSLLLKNALHSYLNQIADLLATNIDRTSGRAAQDKLDAFNFAKVHAKHRATAFYYTLAEAIFEFHILREVIFKVLEEEAPLEARERDIILSAIEQTVNDSATQFAALQLETQEQFMLTLAHDLRNPVAAAKLNAQIVKRDPASGAACVRAAEKIDDKMKRLEAMLQELLDVSRIRAGGAFNIVFEPMRLDHAAQDVIKDMQEIHGDRFILDAEPVSGTWNRDGIRRILENLMVNALKYGSPGAPVTIRVKQNDGHGILVVHNEGNPIPPEDQPKLFDKFLRANTAQTQTGWGLGLTLVSGMAKAHKGTVRVESSAATGTDFIVALPKKP